MARVTPETADRLADLVRGTGTQRRLCSASGASLALVLCFALTATLWLSACSGGGGSTRSSVTNEELCDEPGNKPYPSGSFEIEKVRVTPPTGPEWLPCYERENEPSEVTVQFLRRPPSLSGLGSVNHTVVANLSIRDLEPIMNARPEYRRYSRSEMLKTIVGALTGENNRERFTVVKLERVPQSKPAPDCLRFDSVVEDRGVPGQAGKVFILETNGMACYHPGKPNSVVIASYGEREPQGEKPLAGLHEDGEAFLSSLAFVN